MGITRDEAAESIEEIKLAMQKSRRIAAYAGTDVILIIWGVIWGIGFLTQHFFVRHTQAIWLALSVMGTILTILVSVRAPVKSNLFWRIGALWLGISAYSNLWLFLLLPFVKVKNAEQGLALTRNITAVCATVPMFAYVIMGVWFAPVLLWVGIGVTLTTIGGLFLLPQYFYLWMSISGGAAFIGTGILIRRRWRE